MANAWRIVMAKHRSAAFDGEGARIFGGRWNSLGRRVVYCAGSVSLATLEMLVHLPRGVILPAFVVVPVRIPDSMVEELDPERLPRHWIDFPAPPALQDIGDDWLASRRSLALRVPSAVVPMESNILLNPDHPDFAKLHIGATQPFPLDRRLKR